MNENGVSGPVASLPGEHEVDQTLLDWAVAELNQLYTQRGLETARQVGKTVLNAFFEGDPALFQGHSRKHASFRRLAEHPELDMSYSFIWYSVAVYEQLQELPDEIGSQLPLSHHRLLLPVRSRRVRLDLARRAVRDGLSKRAFEDLVRRARAKEPRGTRGGRRPLPSWVKGLNRLNKAIQLATAEEIGDQTLSNYPLEDAKAHLANLYRQMDTLSELAEKLNLAVTSHETPVPTTDVAELSAAK